MEARIKSDKKDIEKEKEKKSQTDSKNSKSVTPDILMRDRQKNPSIQTEKQNSYVHR
jgi:hypothetical protein